MSMTAERDLLRISAAELEFAQVWSCLAEMKGSKRNLQLLSLIIATILVKFVANFSENSQNEQIIHSQVTCCFPRFWDQALGLMKAPAAFMSFV